MARAMVFSGTALVAAALLVWAPPPATAWNQSSAEATLWQLTNGDRVNNGLPPLIQQATLVSLAQWRSKDMVDRDYFGHTILGTSYQVYHYYDTNGLAWTSGGENIGWNAGYADADSPVAINDGFMNSTGHRTNILNTAWTHGGVGAYGADGVTWSGSVRDMRMYTQLFVKLKSGSPPPPTPAPTQPPATPKPTAKPTPKPTPKPTAVPTAAPTATPHQAPLATEGPATPAPTPGESSPGASGSASVQPVDTQAGSPSEAPGGSTAPQGAVNPFRVESADAADRGIFETVIASLLSFFLG
jgi:uncharacterized protein YkwD